jgi:hypothetical protein
MKRRRGGVPRRGHRSTDPELMIEPDDPAPPVGRLPADDARDEVMLQQLAWQATPAGYSGLFFVAVVAVLTAIRAVIVNLLTLIARGLMGLDDRQERVPSAGPALGAGPVLMSPDREVRDLEPAAVLPGVVVVRDGLSEPGATPIAADRVTGTRPRRGQGSGRAAGPGEGG